MENILVNIVGSVLGAIAAAFITIYFNRRTTATPHPSAAKTGIDVPSSDHEASGAMRWPLIVFWPLACSVPEAILLSIGDDWFLVSIAIAQTLLLRVVLGRECTWAWWWFFASASAWLVVWYDAWFTKLLPFSLIAPTYGILAGVFQWLVLRGHYQNSWWWILVSCFAWTLGLAIGLEIDRGPGSATGIGLFISGLITVFILDYILRHPIPRR